MKALLLALTLAFVCTTAIVASKPPEFTWPRYRVVLRAPATWAVVAGIFVILAGFSWATITMVGWATP